MENEYPWYGEPDDPYINLRTQFGLFELHQYDTFIFRPTNPLHARLEHVYRITDDRPESDSYNGFYLFEHHFTRVGASFQRFVSELISHDFHIEYFEEPEYQDIKAYEEACGEDYKPLQPEDFGSYEPSELFEKIVKTLTKDLDDEWRYYEQDWREDGV